MTDLEALQLSDLKDWYRRWYAPNNATLVVVGDVDPQQVLALAQKHFGPLKPEELAPPKPQKEPRQLGITRLKVKAPAREPYLIMGYKTPVLSSAEEDWEPYALEMLAAILDGGSSARLSRDLLRGERIAADADADYSAYSRLPGMLTLSGVPTPGHDIPDLEAALRGEVEKLRTELVDEEELARVRAQVVAGKVFERDSVHYQALQIGMLETIGLDWRLADAHVERLKQVTAEQVRQVAQKYLIDDHLTVAELVPLPLENNEQVSQNGGEQSYVN